MRIGVIVKSCDGSERRSEGLLLTCQGRDGVGSNARKHLDMVASRHVGNVNISVTTFKQLAGGAGWPAIKYGVLSEYSSTRPLGEQE